MASDTNIICTTNAFGMNYLFKDSAHLKLINQPFRVNALLHPLEARPVNIPVIIEIGHNVIHNNTT